MGADTEGESAVLFAQPAPGRHLAPPCGRITIFLYSQRLCSSGLRVPRPSPWIPAPGTSPLSGRLLPRHPAFVDSPSLRGRFRSTWTIRNPFAYRLPLNLEGCAVVLTPEAYVRISDNPLFSYASPRMTHDDIRRYGNLRIGAGMSKRIDPSMGCLPPLPFIRRLVLGTSEMRLQLT